MASATLIMLAPVNRPTVPPGDETSDSILLDNSMPRPDKNVDLLSCLRVVCSTIGQKQ